MMRVDKVKIINEMRGYNVVQVGVTAFIEKAVSYQKEIDLKDLMKEPWAKVCLLYTSPSPRDRG